MVVSQSGETADTLAALKHAKALGHEYTLAICNVATSSMVRQTIDTKVEHLFSSSQVKLKYKYKVLQ